MRCTVPIRRMIYLRQDVPAIAIKVIFFAALCVTTVVFLSYAGYNWQYDTPIKRRFNSQGECVITPLTSMAMFYQYIDRPLPNLCTELASVGGALVENVTDGNKVLCILEPFRIKMNDCMIFSFGINNEWSFDDEIAELGCKIHAFDPGMGSFDHKRGKNIYFHNLGISNATVVVRLKEREAKLDRYENILKMLHLENRTIDYLKMDVEGKEMQFLNDILYRSPHLLKNIKQIGMEIHPGTDSPPVVIPTPTYKEFYKYLQKIECLGFQVVSVRMNPLPSSHFRYAKITRSCCYEIVWINSQYI